MEQATKLLTQSNFFFWKDVSFKFGNTAAVMNVLYITITPTNYHNNSS